MNFLLNKTFLGMPSNWDLWLILALSIVNVALVILMSLRLLNMLQLGGYKITNFFAWLKENKFLELGRHVIIALLSCSVYAIANLLLNDFMVHRALKYVALIFYFVLTCSYIISICSAPKKTPIVYTKRMIRLIVALGIIAFGTTFGMTYLTAMYSKYFVAGGVCIAPLLLVLFVAAAWCVTYPIEKLISNSYLAKAKDKLARHPEIVVVGVTGSYGKTSVKNIIATLLAQKYKVCVSPFSYNTPLGLARTILQDVTDDTQVLVAEMGARHVGDIAELAQMVKPRVGVITGIANQHMATFGSMQAIINTKSELTDFVTDQKGTMFFNLANTFVQQMYNSCKCEKYQAGLQQDCLVVAKNISCDKDGSQFTLTIEGKDYAKVRCALLGEHNVSNIVLAATVALKMGVSAQQILQGIASLQPTAHRLQLVPSSGVLIVIDDAYNGSEAGAKAALDTLKFFKGGKVIITPGLVELGKEQFNTNFELGRLIASTCDWVIINGQVNYNALSSGCQFGKMDANHILKADSLQQAVDMISDITSQGDVVLFENDLPDNYV